ncbi:MAG: hypothetical protein M3Z85_10960 [Acidobacteriota bacterium]|nr:hypothetical protein [Acidobacteriota bacterium]
MKLRPLTIALALIPFSSFAATREIALEMSQLQLKNVKAESVTFKGRKALRLTDADLNLPDGIRLALIGKTDFQDGVIEIDLAGDTLPGAAPEFRAFTGIAFRATPEGANYEAIYLRPKNGRSEDQLQRNHSAQYVSYPEFPWPLLRKDAPGKYESYVDLVPGEWTKVKIEVRGEKARLYVHGSEQPSLIVNDLKHGQKKGAIALWIGPATVAHFSNLKVTTE